MLYMCVFGAAEREEGIIIEGEEEARLAALRISLSIERGSRQRESCGCLAEDGDIGEKNSVYACVRVYDACVCM